jgi:hypothetical protein
VKNDNRNVQGKAPPQPSTNLGSKFTTNPHQNHTSVSSVINRPPPHLYPRLPLTFLPHTKKMLDLFCGSHSVGDCFRQKGYEVVSLDIDPRCHPTFPCDIFLWDYEQFPPGFFDVVAASVPCVEYSIALTNRPRNFNYSDQLVWHTRKIIEYFNPRVFWVENPRTGYLKNRPCIQGLPHLDLDYCQFCDWGYQKPTRFWCSKNISEKPHVLCNIKSCPQVYRERNGRLRHRVRLGSTGLQASTRQKNRIPPAVVHYLMGWEHPFLQKLKIPVEPPL